MVTVKPSLTLHMETMVHGGTETKRRIGVLCIMASLL